MNARVADKADFIADVDSLPPRTVIDTTASGHGEALIDFCLDTKMSIINGRISPINNNYTCISSKGMSMVDYFLCKYDSLCNVQEFKVITMSEAIKDVGIGETSRLPSSISDHSLLCMYTSFGPDFVCYMIHPL